ncbi:MAG: lipoprotein-releasing ABC transporter ATP-binding protein LolD [Thalassotalea sp.]|nr:lipoprotein-releasing ABC transporter ATP-binding protein LolD [Thalassotalea sp.]
MSSVLQCINLSKSYVQGKNETPVLSELSLDVKRGELLAIVGSSGCGKSTFLHLAGALDTATSGQVLVQGTDLFTLSDKEKAKFRNQNIGFIYQFHHLMMEFSALENVAIPLMIAGESAKIATDKAREMLEKVGLSHRVKHRPAELSGGERQRVAIARALVTSPALVLADEPTGNLDFDTAQQIYQLIKELNQELSISFVVVTHDLALAAKMDRQLRLDHGKLSSLVVQVK